MSSLTPNTTNNSIYNSALEDSSSTTYLSMDNSNDTSKDTLINSELSLSDRTLDFLQNESNRSSSFNSDIARSPINSATPSIADPPLPNGNTSNSTDDISEEIPSDSKDEIVSKPELSFEVNGMTEDIKINNDALVEFKKSLPKTVTILKHDRSEVFLIGTAHFSKESQDDVSLVIQKVRPDIVMVELCPSRDYILRCDEETLLKEAKNINLTHIRNQIQSNGLMSGLFNILLLNMSANLTEKLGMAPGGEFRRAFKEIQALQPRSLLILGDRPINITLQRALNSLSLWQLLKVVWRLLVSKQDVSAEEVEKCKEHDMLEQLLEELAAEFPVFVDVFVNERNLYMCHSLHMAANTTILDERDRPRTSRIVAVVGIGHCGGIKELWNNCDSRSIPNIMVIPPIRPSVRIFKFTVKYSIIGLIGYGVYRIVRPHLPQIGNLL